MYVLLPPCIILCCKLLYLENETFYSKVFFLRNDNKKKKASYKNVAILFVQEHSYTTFFCKFFFHAKKHAGNLLM